MFISQDNKYNIQDNVLEYKYNENKVVFNKGDKFYYINDDDPWYIVGFVNDTDEPIIVIKSWAKYKQRWTYEARRASLFVYDLFLVKQLVRKKSDYKIYVRANKSKE